MSCRARDIVQYIIKNFNTPKADLRNLIVNAIENLTETSLSEYQKSDFINDLYPKVKRQLELHIRSYEKIGVSSDLHFGTISTILINKKADIHLARENFLKYIKDINPLRFEFLCKKVLALEGCENVNVTSYSGDGGIDFYGTKKIVSKENDKKTVFRTVELTVIGQAKRYENKIGIPELRNFIGSFEFSKLTDLKGTPCEFPNPIKSESFQPLSPALLIFITSSEPNLKAWKMAKWLGIRLIGGKELAEILYHNNFAFRKSDKGAAFEPKDLESLISE